MDLTAILVAAIAALPATVAALAAWRTARRTAAKIDTVHVMVNDRLSQLLTATGQAERAAGVEEGRSERRR